MEYDLRKKIESDLKEKVKAFKDGVLEFHRKRLTQINETMKEMWAFVP